MRSAQNSCVFLRENSCFQCATKDLHSSALHAHVWADAFTLSIVVTTTSIKCM